MYAPQDYQTHRTINRQNQQRNEDIPPPQPIEIFELTPNCMSICFMMPFPFFCIGCCLSQSVKFIFNNTNRVLNIKSYCGYCLCCGDKADIPYDEITNLDIRIQPGCYVNHQQAVKVFLLYQRGEIQLSGSIMAVEAMEIDRQVRAILHRCGIAAGQRQSNIPNLFFYPMVAMY